MTRSGMAGRRARLTVLAICLAVVGTFEPSPASADSETASDEAGDVMVLRDAGPRHARGAPFADIVGITSTYRKKRLLIRTQFDELVSKPWHTLYLGVDIQTSDGKEFGGQLLYDSQHGVESMPVFLGDDEHLPNGCSGLDGLYSEDGIHTALDGWANRRRATITFMIPARCFGRPDWVRTGSSSYVVPNSYRVSWRDDARAPYRKPDPGGIYIVPSYGPEIPRG